MAAQCRGGQHIPRGKEEAASWMLPQPQGSWVWSTSEIVPFRNTGGELWLKGAYQKYGSFTLPCWVEWEKDPAQARAANMH